MYRLSDLCASRSSRSTNRAWDQSFRFGTGTELSHLMRDRVELWLKMGPPSLPAAESALVLHALRVIRSHRTLADLRWIIVNSRGGERAARISAGSSGDRKTRGRRGWRDELGRLNRNSMKADGQTSFPLMLLQHHQVDSFVCLASSSSSSLPSSSSSTSSLILSFPLFRMIMSPKNVFLQVFSTLVFEARSKWLLCLCFIVLNASCIKSPPSPRPVCFIFSKTTSTFSRRKSCSALLRPSGDLAYLHEF